MRRARWVGLLLALGTVVFDARAEGAAEPTATDEVLSLVPARMAACFVVSNFADHYDRVVGSELWQRFEKLPAVEGWRASPEFRALQQAEAILTVYFGMNIDELRNDVIGQSVVLAFRPGNEPGVDDVGILLCRVRDAPTMETLQKRLIAPWPGRAVEEKRYRDWVYFRRSELGDRVDFLARLGNVGVLTDKEDALKEVLDTAIDGNGLFTVPTFRDMRRALPDDCLLQLMLDPRAFDRPLAKTLPMLKGAEALLSRSVGQLWSAMHWTAVTVRFDGGLHLGWHLALDEDRLPESGRTWARMVGQQSGFWAEVPSDALAAAAGSVDFPSLGEFFGNLFVDRPDSQVHVVSKIFQQLLGNYDLCADVLPRLGPQVGLVVTRQSADPGATEVFNLVLAVDLSDGQFQKPHEQQPLAAVLENALRPMYVLAGIEQGDHWEMKTHASAAVRFHYLTGSDRLPAWFEPGFAVTDQRLFFASSPGALKSWLERTSGPTLPESKFVRFVARQFPASYVPKLYVDVERTKQLLGNNRADFDALFDAWTPRHEHITRERVTNFLSLVGLFDRAVLGTYGTNDDRHWILSLYPPGSYEH